MHVLLVALAERPWRQPLLASPACLCPLARHACRWCNVFSYCFVLWRFFASKGSMLLFNDSFMLLSPKHVLNYAFKPCVVSMFLSTCSTHALCMLNDIVPENAANHGLSCFGATPIELVFQTLWFGNVWGTFSTPALCMLNVAFRVTQ